MKNVRRKKLCVLNSLSLSNSRHSISLQAVKKLQEIVTNPTQKNPFNLRPTGGSSRRQNNDRKEHNDIRRLEQGLQEV